MQEDLGLLYSKFPFESFIEGSDWFALLSKRDTHNINLIHTWAFESAFCAPSLTSQHESVVCCVKLSADGKYLAVGSQLSAQILDTTTGGRICSIRIDPVEDDTDIYIRALCFSPDSKYLAMGSEDSIIRVWDIAGRRIHVVFSGHIASIESLIFSNSGRLIVSGSMDGTTRIWDMGTGRHKALTVAVPAGVNPALVSVAISPDDRLIATGSVDMVVRLWDVRTGLLIERLFGHEGTISGVAFTPDGEGLVSGSFDTTLKHWDLGPLLRSAQRELPLRQLYEGSGEQQSEKGCLCNAEFTGLEAVVVSAAVSQDSRWVISGSGDKFVYFWDLNTKKVQSMLRAHRDSLVFVDVGATGGLLATGDGGREVRLWKYGDKVMGAVEPGLPTEPLEPVLEYLEFHPTLAPAELKVVGSNWCVVFSKDLPRSQRPDVDLMYTLEHGSIVSCLCFSADGQFLATGCNRSAQIYDTRTGMKTCVLVHDAATQGGELYIRCLCFSPDGKYLATGAEDNQIRVWEVTEQRIQTIFKGHQAEIYSLIFSRDGRFIVSGSMDETARVWDLETGLHQSLQAAEFAGDDAAVASVAISPDGQLVATGSVDGSVHMWDVQTGQLIDRLVGHKDTIYSVAFTPDGEGLVTGCRDRRLKHWDLKPLLRNEQRKVPVRQPYENNVTHTQLGSEKGCVCIAEFVKHQSYVLTVAVSQDGRWVASGSKDRSVLFWDLQTAQAQFAVHGHKNSVIAVDLSPTGGIFATGSGDQTAKLCVISCSPDDLRKLTPVT